MYGKSSDNNYKDYSNSTSTPDNSTYPYKNYMNYVNFQGSIQSR